MNHTTIDDLKERILSHTHVGLRSGGSKTALSRFSDDTDVLEIAGLSGVVDYQPQEFTFTALAGTPLKYIDKMLAENGQYLPFDPLLIEQGATLGGTVASGLSGPGRYRYGGVRDFLLGVKFLNGEGDLVHSGGKVVKNAAGFDISKLMVGSLGQFGALVELSFKVFPRPKDFVTILAEYSSLKDSLEMLERLIRLPLDIFALDLEVASNKSKVLVRIAASKQGFGDRIDRLIKILDTGETLEGEQEAQLWGLMKEFCWVPEGSVLLKVPMTLGRVLDFESFLVDHKERRFYSVGANVAWVSWPGPLDEFDRILTSLRLSGLCVLGEVTSPRLGVRSGVSFISRIKRALDPHDRWVEG